MGKKSAKRDNGWKLLKFVKRHTYIFKNLSEPQTNNKKTQNKSTARHITIRLLRTRNKEKSWKHKERNDTLSIGENNPNDNVFLIRNHRGQCWK